MILAPGLSLPHPEAVARRPGQLTEEDKLKLQSQGVSPDCHNEVGIIMARYKLDNNLKIVDVKLGRLLTHKDVIQCIECLLNTTQNDGGETDVISM